MNIVNEEELLAYLKNNSISYEEKRLHLNELWQKTLNSTFLSLFSIRWVKKFNFYEDYLTFSSSSSINAKLQKLLPEDRFEEIGTGKLKDFIIQNKNKLTKNVEVNDDVLQYLTTLY
jgi:hypothetical protein